LSISLEIKVEKGELLVKVMAHISIFGKRDNILSRNKSRFLKAEKVSGKAE
jgi:hypothetical protein